MEKEVIYCNGICIFSPDYYAETPVWEKGRQQERQILSLSRLPVSVLRRRGRQVGTDWSGKRVGAGEGRFVCDLSEI